MPDVERRVPNISTNIQHSPLGTRQSALPMKIALAGTGKTGQAIARLAVENGHEIVTRFNSSTPLLAHAGNLAGCDVVIDFSRPELAIPHIKQYCEAGIDVVMGTTGWYEQQGDVTDRVAAAGIGFVFAPNFSIGVSVLSRVLDRAAQLMNKLPAYDVAVHELHHRFKLDSPSGTALHLGNILLDNIDRKEKLAIETQHQQIPATDLHVSSQRLGHIFGHHTITFDSPYDQIVLTHDAKNRDGFAFGAIRAAEWIAGKKGTYTLDDLLNDWLEEDTP